MSVKGKKYVASKKPIKKKKKAAKPRIKRVVAPKTMNAGTMSERQFWQMIRHILRKRTIYWLPIVNTRNKAKVPYKGPNKRRKFSFVCESCKKEFPANRVNVHHKEPAGELNKASDLPGFVTRLFCEEDKLSLLCEKCHDKEHENMVCQNKE